MKKLNPLYLALAAVIFAIVMKFLSCPLTEFQCMIDASRAPTPMGTALAEEVCKKQFQK